MGPLSILMQGHSGQRNRDTINVFRKLKIALDLFLISIVYALIHIFIVTNPSSMVHWDANTNTYIQVQIHKPLLGIQTNEADDMIKYTHSILDLIGVVGDSPKAVALFHMTSLRVPSYKHFLLTLCLKHQIANTFLESLSFHFHIILDSFIKKKLATLCEYRQWTLNGPSQLETAKYGAIF